VKKIKSSVLQKRCTCLY